MLPIWSGFFGSALRERRSGLPSPAGRRPSASGSPGERDLVPGQLRLEERDGVRVAVEDRGRDDRADPLAHLPLGAVVVRAGAVRADAPPRPVVVGLAVIEADQRDEDAAAQLRRAGRARAS